MDARERIRRVSEQWFLTEPLLFSVWTTHALAAEPRIHGIRVGAGKIEFNPAFIDALTKRELEQVLAVEAVRILLKHPYTRQPGDPRLAYEASNLTLQEYLNTDLPLPRAREVFGTDEYDRQYFEFYCRVLAEREEPSAQGGALPGSGSGLPAAGGGAAEAAGGGAGEGENGSGGDDGADANTGGDETEGEEQGALPSLETYADAGASGRENAGGWVPDELQKDQIDDRIRTAQESGAWGTIGGRLQERILATLRPGLDYRAVLRQFRASVVSVRRRLTRLKPNRRYDFDYMGSRYEFATRLLFAVDVSGSMGSAELALGFSVVNRFFKYGIELIDVIQFDTEVKGEATTLRRAKSEVVLTGRGGTDFAAVIAYLDAHPGYDGLIVFTDGFAPVPPKPQSRRTRILWLFTNEETYERQYKGLSKLGRAAYLKPAAAPAGRKGKL